MTATRTRTSSGAPPPGEHARLGDPNQLLQLPAARCLADGVRVVSALVADAALVGILMLSRQRSATTPGSPDGEGFRASRVRLLRDRTPVPP
jgi:hypothetical protein